MKAGQSNYGFHGTSVQNVQAKPISVKNHPEDYIMFTRNLNADENTVFQKVNIFGDGRFLFRSFASRLYQPLLLCNRYSSGAPGDPRLFEKKKKLAVDLLQTNLPFFNDLDGSVLKAICDNFSNLSSKLEAMRKPDEYVGESEIIGIIYGAIAQSMYMEEMNIRKVLLVVLNMRIILFLMLNQYDCCILQKLIQALVTMICL